MALANRGDGESMESSAGGARWLFGMVVVGVGGDLAQSKVGSREGRCEISICHDAYEHDVRDTRW